MYLQVEPETVALQALDQVQLPQGTIPVQRRTVQARYHDAQLALATGGRQGRVLEMVIEVHIPHFHHARQDSTAALVGQAVIPGGTAGGNLAHFFGDFPQVAGCRIARHAEGGEHPDVHGRIGCLQHQPHGIHWAQ